VRNREYEKLIFAKHQVSNVLQLIQGNEYEEHMKLSLTKVYHELQRQLNNHEIQGM
jgi:hypothetical protein